MNECISEAHDSDVVLGTRDSGERSVTESFTLVAVIKLINKLKGALTKRLVDCQNLGEV